VPFGCFAACVASSGAVESQVITFNGGGVRCSRRGDLLLLLLLLRRAAGGFSSWLLGS